MPGRILSIGVIGLGGLANSVHLPSLVSLDNVEIKAVCDVDRTKLHNVAQLFGIARSYVIYREMILAESLDAVFILVQPELIFRIAFDCLEAGLDVFMEKPAGITLFQAEALQRKAKEKNRIVQVGLNRRYIPLVRRVVEIMRQTTRINQVEGAFLKHGTAEFYNGCASAFVCDTIHAVDLVRWVAGGKAVQAATVEAAYDSPVANAWNSIIRFDNGVTGIVKANYQAAGRFHTMEIHGPEASAFINLGFGKGDCEARIVFFGGKGSFSISVAGPGDVDHLDLNGADLAGSGEYHRYYGYWSEDQDFLSCVRERRKPICDIGEAVETMRLVELLLDSRI